MKLAAGLATIEDYETGEYFEEYKIVYETKTHSKYLEALEWFARSKYRKVLVVPDEKCKSVEARRGAFAERMGYFIQPDDCYISVTQKDKRVYIEKN